MEKLEERLERLAIEFVDYQPETRKYSPTPLRVCSQEKLMEEMIDMEESIL